MAQQLTQSSLLSASQLTRCCRVGAHNRRNHPAVVCVFDEPTNWLLCRVRPPFLALFCVHSARCRAFMAAAARSKRDTRWTKGDVRYEWYERYRCSARARHCAPQAVARRHTVECESRALSCTRTHAAHASLACTPTAAVTTPRTDEDERLPQPAQPAMLAELGRAMRHTHQHIEALPVFTDSLRTPLCRQPAHTAHVACRARPCGCGNQRKPPLLAGWQRHT
jgi:hypothetical protein